MKTLTTVDIDTHEELSAGTSPALAVDLGTIHREPSPLDPNLSPYDLDLAKSLAAATKAGKWGVAEAIAGEIAARRLAGRPTPAPPSSSSSNVVPLRRSK